MPRQKKIKTVPVSSHITPELMARVRVAASVNGIYKISLTEIFSRGVELAIAELEQATERMKK